MPVHIYGEFPITALKNNSFLPVMNGLKLQPLPPLLCAFSPRVEAEHGATKVGTNSAWIRRHFSDSIYVWACGEKAGDEDDDPKLTDRLIGWLVLFVGIHG